MKIEAKNYFEFLAKNLDELSSTIDPFWHPLGFVSCIIKKNEQVTLRVHYWPKGERRVKNPDWPIHNHSYFLSSYILLGNVRDIRFKATEGSQYLAYSVKYCDGGSAINQTAEKFSVEPIVDELRKAGDSYEVDSSVFHQSIVPKDSSAVTLVALSQFTDSPPIVLGSRGEESYPYERMPYSKDVFWENVSIAVRGKPMKRVN